MLVKNLTSAPLSAFWRLIEAQPTTINPTNLEACESFVGFVGKTTQRERPPLLEGVARVNFCRHTWKEADSVVTTKPTKPTAKWEGKRKHKAKHKVWRRIPYWPACREATRHTNGSPDLEAADQLFASLALRDDHEPNDVVEMLRRVSPLSSTALDYCARVVAQVQVNPAAHVTQERVEKYVAAHPFAWEQRLDVSEIAGVQVLEGVQ